MEDVSSAGDRSAMVRVHRDIAVIRAEHKAVKARLREYEIDYEREHGAKPRKRRDWGPVIDEYEQYSKLRDEEKAAIISANVEPSPSGTRDA